VDLVFECWMLVFEWEGFGLESFQNYTHIYINILFIYFLAGKFLSSS